MANCIKQIPIICVSLLMLAACQQFVPNRSEGLGFSFYGQYALDNARREASMQGSLVSSDTASISSSNNNSVTISDIAVVGINSGPNNAIGRSVEPQVAIASNAEISDEQSFDAVVGRETIESDADRRVRQAAAYQQIQAIALPDRSGDAGPNIVQYALQAPNDRGDPVFNRIGFSGEARFQRNCSGYRTPDDAQRDFIRRGGPQRDRLGVDPDGDGFACGWDPQAFRTVADGN
ncbi:MAG: hypothetical protein OSA51_00255 [Octadecabacter sp.]|nr:hypothetical protein [Octadecabacter sp.]